MDFYDDIRNKLFIFAGRINDMTMDWLHIVAVVILVIAGILIYMNKRKSE
jgi:hypothetical protein